MGSYKTVTTAEGVVTRQWEDVTEGRGSGHQFMYFNLNSTIEFRLSDSGVDILAKECPWIKDPKVGKWYRMQGWEFASVFGPHFKLFGNEPVRMDVRISASEFITGSKY